MDYNQLKGKMRAEALGEQEAKFNEMTSKGRLAGTGKDAPGSPWGEVSSAPSQTVTGAAQPLGASGKTFTGSGGYEYGLLPSGEFMILKSGKGYDPGTVVKPGMKGFNAIKQEFENAKAGRPVTTKPRSSAPKSSPRGVKATGIGEAEDTKLLRKSAMRRQESRERLTRDLMQKGMPLDEAKEFAKRFRAPGGYDTGEPATTDNRMARK